MQQRKLDNQNVHGVPASGRVCQKGVLLWTLAQSIDLICLMMAHPTANPGKDHVTLRDGRPAETQGSLDCAARCETLLRSGWPSEWRPWFMLPQSRN